MGATVHTSRLNSPYRRAAGPSSPADKYTDDLAMELGRLLDHEYERPPVANDGHYSLRSMLAKNDAKLASARRSLRDDYSQSRRRYQASQFADAEQSRQYDEHPYDARYRAPLRAEPDGTGYFDRYAAAGPDEEMVYDDSPHERRRGGLVTALVLIGWATVATAGAYAYRNYYFGPVSTRTSVAPSHAKPAQPGARGAPPAAATSAGASGYAVQVSAQRSKADAETSFRALQEKFPRQLAGRTAIIRRTDLGAKGIYYRAFVGPFASAGEADQFCGRFKTAGGQCFVTRN